MFDSSVGCEHREGIIRAVAETEEIVAVCLEGDLDMTNAPDLDAHIDRTLEAEKHLILDLSEATFIDSSLINALVRGVKVARERERAIVLQLGTAAIVERVLEISRIEQVLPRAHNRQEALRMIEKKAMAGSARCA